MNLNGKVAIVTGISSGIGLSVVQKLLEKGAQVVGWGRNAPNLKSDKFLFVPCDIREHNQVISAMGATLAWSENTCDILINNAGVGLFAKAWDTSVEDWQRMFDTNVHGLFYATKAVLPVMLEQKSGHIINIASLAALSGIEEASGYCATKFAVRGFSQALFKEVKKQGVKVSCVFPGSVNTRFFDTFDNITANETMLNPDDVADALIHLLETPDNFLTSEMEIRPMNPRYK